MESLSVAGPKLAFCAGPLVDALLRAKADHHVRFKAVEASYIWRYFFVSMSLHCIDNLKSRSAQESLLLPYLCSQIN